MYIRIIFFFFLSLSLSQVLSSQKVIQSLLSFVVSNDTPTNGGWSSAQFEELQLLVMKRNNNYCLFIVYF